MAHKLTSGMNTTRIFFRLLLSMLAAFSISTQAFCADVLKISAASCGKTFDGIGAVNGGGATSVLLKDYPSQQRDEILDMVFRPMFGASVSTMLAEIPGDGNSTQGSMPSHSHYRGDYNFQRGYMWWVMREAKLRNSALALDATAWSAPGWVGPNDFWSNDMANYYTSWLSGLRRQHGLELDALGCHNEKGWNADFAKMLRRAMDEAGFADVKLHGFDNWGENKLEFLPEMLRDSTLRNALDVVSCHTFSEIPITKEQREMAEQMGKPIWNSEDHIYLPGFSCLIGIVKAFNENYIVSGATRVINWYDIAGVYPLEPYSVDPAMILAHEPWSGNYSVREALWGYAHYGQFTEVGWKYMDEGCCKLPGGGTIVTMRNPKTGDYSIIAETSGATGMQTVKVSVGKGLKKASLCQWFSDENAQFVRLEDVKPRSGVVTVKLKPGCVYSFSTKGGQRHGSFEPVPAHQPFPIPYSDDFDSYGSPEQWGYLPHYWADIIGCFELSERPDHKGQCLRQVVGQHTNSWAPEWHFYTILGDAGWKDYSVSANVWLNPGDEAGVMGHISFVGSGYGVWAKGYYLKIDDKGRVSLMITRGKLNPKELVGDAEQRAAILARTDIEVGGEYVLDSAFIDSADTMAWHRLKLEFVGDGITGYVDGKPVVHASSSRYDHGMVGLIAPSFEDRISTPYFDDFSVEPAGSTLPSALSAKPVIKPLY